MRLLAANTAPQLLYNLLWLEIRWGPVTSGGSRAESFREWAQYCWSRTWLPHTLKGARCFLCCACKTVLTASAARRGLSEMIKYQEQWLLLPTPPSPKLYFWLPARSFILVISQSQHAVKRDTLPFLLASLPLLVTTIHATAQSQGLPATDSSFPHPPCPVSPPPSKAGSRAKG